MQILNKGTIADNSKIRADFQQGMESVFYKAVL